MPKKCKKCGEMKDKFYHLTGAICTFCYGENRRQYARIKRDAEQRGEGFSELSQRWLGRKI